VRWLGEGSAVRLSARSSGRPRVLPVVVGLPWPAVAPLRGLVTGTLPLASSRQVSIST
jgi:hypothetical protein